VYEQSYRGFKSLSLRHVVAGTPRLARSFLATPCSAQNTLREFCLGGERIHHFYFKITPKKMKNIFTALLVSLGLMGCSVETQTPEILKMENGLQYEILQPGAGSGAEVGDNLKMHYTGFLIDGTKFDSSLDRGQTFNFTLGGGQVIRGWDEGLVGMKVGEKRKLTIPPALGYGAQNVGPIPADSTLIFEVELVENFKNKIPGLK
jgi:FKBP-type peptidyl-prolyl cis-trans isomerase FkpA